MTQKSCVIVHAGAGYHSKAKEIKYNQLCSEACSIAAQLMNVESRSAADAAVAAVVHLEDGYITNAGIGSNLNISGYVECDAGIMSADDLKFAGVGSVQNIKNPIKLANILLQCQINKPVGELGRICPSLLVGDGVRRWAISNGFENEVIGHNLVTSSSFLSWQKYKRWLNESKSVDLQSKEPEMLHISKRLRSERLDTVGAVCLDTKGNIVSAVSSGGIALKCEGRIGQACIYGCGCWAERSKDSSVSVGVVTSGTGEQLVKTQLAQRVAERLFNSDEAVPVIINSALLDGFMNSRYLSDEEKYAGIAGIYTQSYTSDNRVAEIFFAHTTRSMSIGYFVPDSMPKPCAYVSKRSNNTSIHIEAFSYRIVKRNNSDSPTSSTVGLSGDESSGLTTRKRRRLVNASQLDLCQELFDKIRSYRSEDGSLSETFMKLPSRRSNSDYYEAVRQPIDLVKIQAKIKAAEYENVDEMASDIRLLVANTKAFYPASTTEFAKAVELQDLFENEARALRTLTVKSTASTASSTSSSAVGRRSRSQNQLSKSDDREEDEAETLSIAASDDSHIAASETSTTNQTTTSQSGSIHTDNPMELFFAAIVKYVTDDGRSIAPTFTYLPSKELYPVYYVVIKEPIDLRMIARRVLSGAYNSLEDMEKDFALLARNAKAFNEPKSAIYQDASILSRIIKGKRSEAEHPPVRTNRERGKRTSRLNYVPREITEEYAAMPDIRDNDQLDDSTDGIFETSTGDEDEDTRATGTSMGSSVNSTPIKRRRGRPRRDQFEDTYKQSPTGEPLSPASTTPSNLGISNNSDTVPALTSLPSTSATRAHRRLQDKLFHAILDAKNEENQLLSIPFYRLPSRRLYPDYYDEITNPLCLSEVKKRIKRYNYATLEPLLADLDTVFNNAQRYNVEQSAIHHDSMVLQQLAHKKYEELRPVQAALAIKPDLDSSAGDFSNNGTTGLQLKTDNIGQKLFDQSSIKRLPKRVLTPAEAFFKQLQNLYKAVYYYRTESGRFPRDSFIKLPDVREFPNYYEIIKTPIDLSIIKHKMDNGKYNTPQEMISDLRLMCDNAKQYNQEGSEVYNDAVILDSLIMKRLKNLTSNPPVSKQPNIGSLSNNLVQDFSCLTSSNTSGGGGGTQLISSIQNLPHNQTASNLSPLQRAMLELFQTVRDYHVNGRILSNPFMRLPTRSELPTYYEFIKRPIEMQQVAKQLVQGGYTDFEEFASDLFLMFDNACRFNEPNSQIYLDALILHRVCLAKRALILASLEQTLSIPPAVSPDIWTGIRRLLTNLHNAMLTACDSDGRGLVDSLIAGDGVEGTLTSVTAARLAALHRAVAAGAYRRLDHLQHDWLRILYKARVGEGVDQPVDAKNPTPTKQQRIDSRELSRRWVRLRDELCRRPPKQNNNNNPECNVPNHLSLVSPALSYTEAVLERNLAEEESQYSINHDENADMEEKLPPLAENEEELQQFDLHNQSYFVGDYVYIEPMRTEVTQCHVGRITRISRFSRTDEAVAVTDKSLLNIRVAMYSRPSEVHPSRRRRLLAAEVFRTSLSQTITVGQIIGRCLVMHIAHFIRCKPKNWNIEVPRGVELEARPVPFIPTRLPPSEPLENALEQVKTDLFVEMSYPSICKLESVVMEDLSETEKVLIYEQYVHNNGFSVKLGDFLYLPKFNGSNERIIVRVDKLWKSLSQNAVLFSGPLFVSPLSVDHLPTRLFFPKEVFMTDSEHITYGLATATGKCFVMRPLDYAYGRPTEIPEQDIYLCDSKYFENEKVIRKLKKGLKKFDYTEKVREDEFYYFSQAICPRKDASPLLVQASNIPLNQEQISRQRTTNTSTLAGTISTNDSFKLETVDVMNDSIGEQAQFSNNIIVNTNNINNLAANNIIGTAGNSNSSGSNLVQTLTTAQLEAATEALMDVNVDRTGKRRKLRKPPSGYIVYASEVRKKLLQDRPETPFGEISKEVGLMWRQMSLSQREFYEQKAQLIRKHMEDSEMHFKTNENLQIQHHLAAQNPGVGLTTDDKASHTLVNITPGTPIQPNTIPMIASNNTICNTNPRMSLAPPPAATMQFYQTPTGQVIQIVHGASAPGAPVVPHPSSTVGQSHGFQNQPAIQVPYSSVPTIASAGPLVPGTHQVVYQLANQNGVNTLNNIQQAPYYSQQFSHQNRLVVASTISSTPAAMITSACAPLINPPMVTAPPNLQVGQVKSASMHSSTMGTTYSTGNLSVPQQQQQQQLNNAGSIVPTNYHTNIGTGLTVATMIQPHQQNVLPPQEPGSQIQPQYHLVQQVQSNQQTLAPNMAPVAIGNQITPYIPTQQHVITQSQINRAPFPVFVSAPPRTSRVLHSEIYQRYINRLRKNATNGLSDWQTQLSLSTDNAKPVSVQHGNQLLNNFFADSKKLSNYNSVTHALWNLRDYLMEDALKIRMRCLNNSMECL